MAQTSITARFFDDLPDNHRRSVLLVAIVDFLATLYSRYDHGEKLQLLREQIDICWSLVMGGKEAIGNLKTPDELASAIVPDVDRDRSHEAGLAHSVALAATHATAYLLDSDASKIAHVVNEIELVERHLAGSIAEEAEYSSRLSSLRGLPAAEMIAAIDRINKSMDRASAKTSLAQLFRSRLQSLLDLVRTDPLSGPNVIRRLRDLAAQPLK
jgi:hypothetical protein